VCACVCVCVCVCMCVCMCERMCTRVCVKTPFAGLMMALFAEVMSFPLSYLMIWFDEMPRPSFRQKRPIFQAKQPHKRAQPHSANHFTTITVILSWYKFPTVSEPHNAVVTVEYLSWLWPRKSEEKSLQIFSIENVSKSMADNLLESMCQFTATITVMLSCEKISLFSSTYISFSKCVQTYCRKLLENVCKFSTTITVFKSWQKFSTVNSTYVF